MKKKIMGIIASLTFAFALSACSKSDAEIKRADDWKEMYPDVYAT